MEKGADFVLSEDRQLEESLGEKEDFHIVEDQFSIWRTKLLSVPTHPGWKGFSNRAIKAPLMPHPSTVSVSESAFGQQSGICKVLTAYVLRSAACNLILLKATH